MSDSTYMTPKVRTAKTEQFTMVDMSELLVTDPPVVPTAMLNHPDRKETKQSDKCKPTSKLLQPNHESHLTLKEKYRSHLAKHYDLTPAQEKGSDINSSQSTCVEVCCQQLHWFSWYYLTRLVRFQMNNAWKLKKSGLDNTCCINIG